MKDEKRKKIAVSIIVALGFLAVIGLVILAVINTRLDATLNVLVAPTSAEVVINGKKYENGDHKIESGEAVAVVSKEGFVTQEVTLKLTKGETTNLHLYLMPEDGTYDWYYDHEDEMMILNTIGDNEANKNSASYVASNPIIEILPIIYADYDENWDYTEYRVDGGSFDECEKVFCLKITDTTGGNRDAAMNKIREKGFNPDDYEIIYSYSPIKPLE